MLMLSRLLALFHGKDEKITETKAEVTVEKPTKQEILDVYEKLRRSVYGYVDVTPSSAAAIDYLKKAGLVALTEEHVLDGNRGLVVKRYAKWVGGWSCNDCVHGSTCEKNVGKEIWYHDTSFGRRCQRFMHKKLVEVMGDGC
jgi:predicted nucleic acid-binding protein